VSLVFVFFWSSFPEMKIVLLIYITGRNDPVAWVTPAED